MENPPSGSPHGKNPTSPNNKQGIDVFHTKACATMLYIYPVLSGFEKSAIANWSSLIMLKSKWFVSELDGVGPVDNRPSTDKLHHFVRRKKEKTIKKKNVC